MLFPNIVEKKGTVLPFVYYTGNSQFYEQSTGHVKWSELPSISKTPEIKVSPEHLDLLNDWRKSFVQSVRQITIRQMTTKSNSGTLPIFAYGTKENLLSDVDFSDLLEGDTLVATQRTFLPKIMDAGTICAVTLGKDIHVAILKQDVFQGQETVDVTLFKIQETSLTSESCTHTQIPCTSLGKIFYFDSVPKDTVYLTEEQYEELFHERYQEDIEDTCHEVDDIVITSGTSRGVQRTVKRPKKLQDYAC